MAGRLVGRTRPDLQYATMVISQLLTSNPAEACRRAEVVIRYLRWSSKVGLKYDAAPDNFGKRQELAWKRDSGMLESVSDASLPLLAVEASAQLKSSGQVVWSLMWRPTTVCCS